MHYSPFLKPESSLIPVTSAVVMGALSLSTVASAVRLGSAGLKRRVAECQTGAPDIIIYRHAPTRVAISLFPDHIPRYTALVRTGYAAADIEMSSSCTSPDIDVGINVSRMRLFLH